jgi:hypothetical protein
MHADPPFGAPAIAWHWPAVVPEMRTCALAHPWPERSALLELPGAGVALTAIDHDVGAGDP